VTPEIEKAIGEIQQALAEQRVEAEGEPQGGAYVVAYDVSIGAAYTPSVTWFGFLISFEYPHADVYPHFIDPQVTRVDGRSLGSGFSGPTDWRNRPAIQVSRRSNRWDPAVDTAVAKLLKVIKWVKEQ